MDNTLTVVRSWLGTPWKHGVALKGWGVDCAQFIIEVYKELGWLDADHKVQPYSRDYALHNAKSIMVEEAARFCREVEEPQVGDLLMFKEGLCESHIGIFIGDGKFIHSHVRHGVHETDLTYWQDDLCSVWRRK